MAMVDPDPWVREHSDHLREYLSASAWELSLAQLVIMDITVCVKVI